MTALAAKIGSSKRWTRVITGMISYTLLVLIALIFVIPFYWMLSASFKPEQDVFSVPLRWWPTTWRPQNYLDVFNRVPMLLFTFNSLKICILGTLGGLWSCSMAAYAFARLRIPGKNVIFLILLATMMIPGEVTLIPVYLIMTILRLVNTHEALYLGAFFGGAYGTFLLRQFFRTLPSELDDAALIDGCSRFGIYWRIYLPLSKPALATLGVFSFMGYWNDLLGPVIYLNDREKLTLAVGLTYFRGFYSSEWNLLMAACVVSVVPILVIYVLAQKYFVQGIALTGLKG